MASVNLMIILGNLGRDPEVRHTPNGDAVCTLNVATSETWKDKSGEKQEKTEWHRVVLFGRPAEIAGEYLKKGRSVYLEGKMQTRSFDKDGEKRYISEMVAHRIQLLGSVDGPNRPAAPAGGSNEYADAKAGKPQSAERRTPATGDFDDDIPF